jgi:hypothetical protein
VEAAQRLELARHRCGAGSTAYPSGLQEVAESDYELPGPETCSFEREATEVKPNREQDKAQQSAEAPRSGKVLLDEKEAERPPLTPAPEFGWYLLSWIGLVFVLVGGLDLALTWYPFGFGNPEWEFGTVSAVFDGLPVPTLGLALLLGAGVAAGSRWLVRVMAIALALAALAIVVAFVLYATNIPIALQTVTEPLVRLGLKKAITKTCGQALFYSVFFVWVAVKGWAHTARQ